MIQYTLQCDRGHSFDSWFESWAAFDALAGAGHLSCAVCGSSDVRKAMMAPRVVSTRTDADAPGKDSAPAAPVDTYETPPAPRAAAKTTGPELQRALAELRRQVEARSDYVGAGFAREARAIHLGETPERSIHGEATPAEARSLVEDGVPILPLPFTPRRKTN